jgi:hypothetical protein
MGLRLGFLRKKHSNLFVYQMEELLTVEGMTHEETKQVVFGFMSKEKYVHSVCGFGDGSCGTSLPRGGVQFVRLAHPEYYDWVETHLTKSHEDVVHSWYEGHLNDGYNWRGYLFGKQVEGKEYCSESVVEACQMDKHFMDVVPWQISASKLRQLALVEFNSTLTK